MGLSRRKFIQLGTLATIATGVPLQVFAKNSSLGSIAGSLLGHNGNIGLDMAAFKANLNTVFKLSNTKGEISHVTLASIYDWRARGKNKTRECFSLIFSGSTSPLTQDVYSVTHASLGSFSMLLVPSGKSKRNQQYEAVFNRLK